ncbi:MAG: oligoendopeptidase F [Vicinamibacterales bacterium]
MSFWFALTGSRVSPLDPACALTPQGGGVVERADIAESFTWNLADLYPSVDAWQIARAQLETGLPQLRAFKGTLGSSPAALAATFESLNELRRTFSRVAVYASLLGDQDTRAAGPQGMRQQVTQLAAALNAEAAYIEPEVLRFPAGTVERFLAEEARLAPFRFDLEDILRRAAHTLSPEEERILADAGPMGSSASTIFTVLSNADFPYPHVRLSDGREVRLTPAAYTAERASAVRADRQAVMAAFFRGVGAFGRTFGSTMNASVQKAWFFAKARHYTSTLAASLDANHIPQSVYSKLVEGVNRHLPTFHRYLRLRRRMLGVDELHYYDLYAPLVGTVNLTYTPEEAGQHIIAAMAPLGAEYVSVLGRAFGERWIDLFPTAGKRSGAYSSGSAYDVHPYMLLNYNGKYDDMSTLAHELGHTMHSYYSNRTQPFATAGYPIFVAEVASTFNESLLVDYMLRQVTDPSVRLALLGNYLDGIKGTVFRQTQFAEFELRMHEMAQRGDPVTGEALATLYVNLTRRYYGHDEAVCRVDDEVAHEWSFIPHFYREFYVFQYATSFTASEALAGQVKGGAPGSVDRYLKFISAGGSKYPVDLLRDAGIDMTSDEPLDATMLTMNRVMDEMERLIAAGATVSQ